MCVYVYVFAVCNREIRLGCSRVCHAFARPSDASCLCYSFAVMFLTSACVPFL
jgi:hypothetical protein